MNEHFHPRQIFSMILLYRHPIIHIKKRKQTRIIQIQTYLKLNMFKFEIWRQINKWKNKYDTEW